MDACRSANAALAYRSSLGKEIARVEEIGEGSSLTGLLLQAEEEGLRFVNPSPFSRGTQRKP